MSSINHSVDGSFHNSPVLEINHLNSYSFYTPNDTGTGTRHKGVIVFDLTILQTTTLPALIHDSIMFNSMEYNRMLAILKQYTKFNKQIFIAYDDPENTYEEIKRILFDNKVLKLSEKEQALFGYQWA